MHFTMPGNNKTNKTGPSTVVSPNKNTITQEYDESSKSSLQNASEHQGLSALQDVNKQKYSNIDGNILLQDSDNNTD
eukprot:11947809-Ditylum_brightwellii.AAC.1